MRLGLGRLPDRVTWRHIWAAGWVVVIGFTVWLFVAELALVDQAALDVAKVAILGASLIAGVGGRLVLRDAAADRD